MSLKRELQELSKRFETEKEGIFFVNLKSSLRSAAEHGSNNYIMFVPSYIKKSDVVQWLTDNGLIARPFDSDTLEVMW